MMFHSNKIEKGRSFTRLGQVENRAEVKILIKNLIIILTLKRRVPTLKFQVFTNPFAHL